MRIFLIATFSILLSVAAQFSLKAGMSSENVQESLIDGYSVRTILSILMNKYIFLGFLFYGLSAIVWLGVLSKWDVSKAYPFVGMGFVFTAIVGFLIGEQITINRLIGIVLISAGIFFIGKN